jgi:hypothetical protein
MLFQCILGVLPAPIIALVYRLGVRMKCLNEKNSLFECLRSVAGFVAFAFCLEYVIEGWSEDGVYGEGIGIAQFHDKCTEANFGDWAYGILILLTVLLSISGVFLVCVLVFFCCLSNSQRLSISLCLFKTCFNFDHES